MEPEFIGRSRSWERCIVAPGAGRRPEPPYHVTVGSYSASKLITVYHPMCGGPQGLSHVVQGCALLPQEWTHTCWGQERRQRKYEPFNLGSGNSLASSWLVFSKNFALATYLGLVSTLYCFVIGHLHLPVLPISVHFQVHASSPPCPVGMP